MKILHITNMYYPSISGVGQVTRDIVKALGEKGNKQKVICFNSVKKGVSEEIDGAEIIRLKPNFSFRSQQVSFSYPALLRKTIDSFKPDVVFINFPNPFLIYFLLQYKKRDFRLFTFWHSDIVKQKVLSRFFNPMIKRMISRSEKILYSTETYFNGSKYMNLTKDKAVIIPLQIDTSVRELTKGEEAEVVRLKNEYKDKILCVNVSRHVPYKGLEYLIDASKDLDDRYRFVFLGAGRLTESLKERAKGNNKISFVTNASNSIKKAYLNACDIFCFPSITKNEAFGIALGEAMLCGKPAITFHIEGSGVNELCRAGLEGIECRNPLEDEGRTGGEALLLKKKCSGETPSEKEGKDGKEHSASGNTAKEAEIMDSESMHARGSVSYSARTAPSYAEGLLALSDKDLRTRLGIAARVRVETIFNKERFKENLSELLEKKV